MANHMTAVGRLGANQNIAFSGSAGISAPVSSETYRVRVMVTAAAYVLISNGTAATSAATIMGANFPETFLLTPGQTVSALQVTAAGTLSVTELS